MRNAYIITVGKSQRKNALAISRLRQTYNSKIGMIRGRGLMHLAHVKDELRAVVMNLRVPLTRFSIRFSFHTCRFTELLPNVSYFLPSKRMTSR
jgi:hypothetical protein